MHSQCSKCLGTGKTYDSFQMDYLTCSRCGGSGRASGSSGGGGGGRCQPCAGTGAIVTGRGVERCALCGGTGKGR